MKQKFTVFDAINYLLFILITIVCIYPFYYVVIYSISNPELASKVVLLPKGFSLQTYKTLFSLNNICLLYTSSNSLKYMGSSRERRINLRVKDVGDFVQVEIEDNGKGIAAKDLPNIFDRFYRTDASRNSSKGGSGIGLSIVKKIMEDHGGKVWATSKENIGTVMYFVLRKYQEVPMNE